MNVIECNELTKTYGNVKALDQLSLTIGENKIVGLIGRNGAGKTTLMKILAGYWRETSGEVRVFAERPFNNLAVSANTILIDDQMNFPVSLSLREILEAAEPFYEHWDRKLAFRLLYYFEFNENQIHKKLSKGRKSTFNMIVGLALHSPLTI